MINLDVREEIPDGAIILENYAYDNSIIGITVDGRVVYDYEKMIEELVTEADWTVDDAMEWISYNTIPALPYMGEMAPIIMYPIIL